MKSKFLAIGVVLAFTLSVGFAVYLFQREQARIKIPILGQVATFSLTDQNGEAFDSAQLAGKVWIVDFFFTTCGNICPIMTKNMAALSRTFERVPAVRLVSISVNPETDTSAVLKEYAQKQGTSSDNWYFLTGSREAITEIAVKNFKVGSVEEPIFHSPHFILVDRYGYIRGYYDGTQTESLNLIFKDAAKLLNDR